MTNNNQNKLVKDITAQEEDFAQWYSDICLKAELMSYSAVQGFIMYLPYGFAIWENIKHYLDQKFKETGHNNVYFPLLISESMFNKEKDHIKGFAPEAAIITTTGVKQLPERLLIRPTSEILFADYYSSRIRSHRDLPMKLNQWCSVVRWEKTTRPFLRGKEFLWQEGHTVHATSSEAQKETLDMLEVYRRMGEELLAIPFVTGVKTEKEKFAGAEKTYSIEALMPDGKALQSGTTHYFGDGFARAFNISFTNQNNEISFAYQTSWGVSTRLIGAIIMVHGDSDGLVLPPKIAPYQVGFIPIDITCENSSYKKIITVLNKLGLRYDIDERDRSLGYKYADMEMKGYPLRITLGKKELANKQVSVYKRNTREKILVNITDLITVIPELLNQIHSEMLDKANNYLLKHTHTAKTYEEFKEMLDLGGYVKMSVNKEAEEIIKADTNATARVILENNQLITKTCPVTGKPSHYTILFARAY